ncbi:MAG: amino acid ABC transporter permease [Vampirovibrionales bacterium]|nr:amino acid ABC transporter permease [Vampirovibrionales bacterium]
MRDFHFEDILTGWPLLAQGLVTTVILAVLSALFSLPLGIALGSLRADAPRLLWPLRVAATLYIEGMRSLPLILWLAFVHYGLMFWVNNALDRPSSFLESALAGFILFEAAYFAEIWRGGLLSVRSGERDAARSLGLSPLDRYRRIYAPLAFSRALPALVGQLISLLKDTSLASIIGVMELTRMGEILYQNTYHDFEALVFLALTYFLLCFGLSALGRRLEAILSKGRAQMA